MVSNPNAYYAIVLSRDGLSTTGILKQEIFSTGFSTTGFYSRGPAPVQNGDLFQGAPVKNETASLKQSVEFFAGRIHVLCTSHWLQQSSLTSLT